MSKKLKIGLSACFFHADPKRALFKGKTLQYIEQSMAWWFHSHDILVYLIPSPDKKGTIKLKDYAEDLDGLLLQGGSDVSPKSYGEEPIKPEWSGDKIRDDYEIELVQEFKKIKKPVLGVCRGLQLLNVAFSGTLYQDINHQVTDSLIHRNWDIYDNNQHNIKFTKNSWLRNWYPNKEIVKVNSVHHQGIKNLGTGLISEAISDEDGIIEAIRYDGDSWIYGVQWHPEFHAVQEPPSKIDPTFLDSSPLLQAFTAEALKRKNRC